MNIFPKTDTAALKAAQDEALKLKDQRADLDKQLTAVSRKLHDAKARLGMVAGKARATGDRKEYNRLYDEVTALERDVAFISDAAAALDGEITEQFNTIRELALGKNLKLFDKLLDEQTEAAKAVEADIARVTDSYSKLVEAGDRIRNAWPTPIPPTGYMLFESNVAAAVSREMFRINPATVLTRKQSKPILPAPETGTLLNPTKLPSLTDTVKQCKDATMREVRAALTKQVKPTARPAPAVAAEVPSAAPAPAVPQQTFNALEIQAGIKPVVLTTGELK